jgi:hypothetical protein
MSPISDGCSRCQSKIVCAGSATPRGCCSMGTSCASGSPGQERWKIPISQEVSRSLPLPKVLRQRDIHDDHLTGSPSRTAQRRRPPAEYDARHQSSVELYVIALHRHYLYVGFVPAAPVLRPALARKDLPSLQC